MRRPYRRRLARRKRAAFDEHVARMQIGGNPSHRTAARIDACDVASRTYRDEEPRPVRREGEWTELESHANRPRVTERVESSDSHARVAIRRNGDDIAARRDGDGVTVALQYDRANAAARRIDCKNRVGIRAGDENAAARPNGAPEGSGESDVPDRAQRGRCIERERRRIEARLDDRQRRSVGRECRSLRHRAGGDDRANGSPHDPSVGEKARRGARGDRAGARENERCERYALCCGHVPTVRRAGSRVPGARGE